MFLTPSANGLILRVKIVPNASRTAFAGMLGEALKIKVAQPPEAGRANRALIDLLAKTLHLPPAAITLTAGHTSPRKTLLITGITLPDATALLTAACDA